MKIKGPLVTLAAGAVLAAGLLVANLHATNGVTTTSGVTPTTSVAASPAAPSSPRPASSLAASAAPVVQTAATQATYAGKVDGGGSLSVAVKGNSAVAYLCDGTNEAWLWGPVDGTALSLHNKHGDTLTATRGGGRLTGSLTVHGRTWTFRLPSVTKPSGVYRATAKVRGATVVAGWVVLPDGSQVGLQTTIGGTSTPAAPIDPTTGAATLDGQPVTATTPDAASLAA